NSTLNISDAVFAGNTVNISGNDTATLSGGHTDFTVNLEKGARWSGTFHLYDGGVTVNGGADAAFNNNGGSTLGFDAGAAIGSDVVGVGSFDLEAGGIEFVKSVGSGQSITAVGGVRVDQPNEFNATVTFLASIGAVYLKGLAAADSYSYANDLLNIWSGS